VFAGEDLRLVSVNRIFANDALEHVFGIGVAFSKDIISPPALIFAYEFLHSHRVQLAMKGRHQRQ
jgi:hypothetical protein